MPKSQARPANSAKPGKSAKAGRAPKPEKASKKAGVKPSPKAASKAAKAGGKPSPAASSEEEDDASAPYVDLARPELLKQLVHSDEEVRAKALSAVQQLLKTKRTLAPEDLQKLWKGLWYTMWHSDTPLVQQALARDLASLFGAVAPKNYAVFVDAFWLIMVREWDSLDKWRINKFYMLIRLVLGAQLSRLGASQWEASAIAAFTEALTRADHGPLSYGNAKAPHSLRLHLVDIYVDELAKAASPAPDREVLRALLAPVTSQLEFSEFKHVKQRVREEVMEHEQLVEWGIVVPEAPAPEEDESDFDGFD